MASKIEDIIEQIEDYIDTCKPAAFSGSKIVVNRDELDAYLDDLKTTTPEEIKRYQKIISNKEAILADAKNKADAIIAEAQIQTSELVSEHQIMQQAYAQANEVVMIATKNAQEMLDKATEDANNIRLGAMEYTDNLLKSIEEVLVGSIDTTKARTDKYLNTMQGFLDVVVANREELRPQEEVKSEPAAVVAEEKPAAPEEPKKDEGPSIAISEEFFNKD
jgi:cell division septum initiation protein DivIVA